MVRQNSIETYIDINLEGKVDRQQDAILAYVMRHPKSTRREIATALNIDSSSVSGRVNELVGGGKLIELAKRKDTITGRTASPVCIPAGQLTLGGLL